MTGQFDNKSEVYEEVHSLNYVLNEEEAVHASNILKKHRIKHTLQKLPYGIIILVDRYQKVKAEYILYKEEKERLKKPLKPLKKVNLLILATVFSSLISFHFITVMFNRKMWLSLGRASADKIMDGEIFRTVTALTLHSDVFHVLSNTVFGFLAIFSLAGLVGTGNAWLLTILAGSIGNFINAASYQTSHNAIGASTAVFAAFGILGTVQFFKEYSRDTYKKWIPFAASFALLGFLGSSEKTDIFAHFFGFLSGAVLGIIFGFIPQKYAALNQFQNFLISILSGLFVVISWIIAIS